MAVNASNWTIEQLVDFLQERDFQMDAQVTYFDVAEEVALRVSNLLACTRYEDRGPSVYRHGHMLYTDEIREALASTTE